VIAAVLLVVLAITLGAIIFTWSLGILNLSPPVNCDGLGFRAEIGNTNGLGIGVGIGNSGGAFLDVVNIGIVRIEGFVIKSVDDREIRIIEEIDYVVATGNTERIDLSVGYGGEFLVVPKIFVQDDSDGEVRVCEDGYGEVVEV